MRLYDAHNHLQDERFGETQDAILTACRTVGVVRMVVNGSCEEDWPAVRQLARRYPHEILPSFGCHPWYVAGRTPHWRDRLLELWDTGECAVGEIGLDRWKPGLGYEDQEAVFLWQLEQAAERDLAVSIHCLRTWGRLLELLQSHPLPRRGFLLHSFGGPREMIAPLARLGAFFSLPGSFAHEQKERQRAVFREIPLDRLLVESDAPDQLIPEAKRRFACADPTTGKPLNHPANLPVVYALAADLQQLSPEALAVAVEANFQRLFGTTPA